MTKHSNKCSSVAPICKFADIPIYRFLSTHTADTDTDTDIYTSKLIIIIMIEREYVSEVSFYL